MVSIEELMFTAVDNNMFYFELQKFDMKKIHNHICFFGIDDDAIIYFSGSEQSGYEELFNEKMTELFKEFNYLKKYFVLMDIEDMDPLEEIIGKSIGEEEEEEEEVFNDDISIVFVYSPYNRESFKSIEEYVSKCPDLQEYENLYISICENEHIEEDKEKEVTNLEVTRFCRKYNIDNQKFDPESCDEPKKTPEGFIRFEYSSRFNTEKFLVQEKDDCSKYHIKSKFAKSGVVNFYQCYSFYDIYFCSLSDNDIELENERYNYIIACNSSDFRGAQVKEIEKVFLNELKPKYRQHYIRFKKNEIDDVLNQYYELQEPAKETIHIFGDNELMEALLNTGVVGFVKDEECKLVRFNNHIFKYKVEFHDDFSFNSKMDYFICFADIGNESDNNSLLKEIEANGTDNFLFLVQNKGDFSKGEAKTRVENIKASFGKISNKIELFNYSCTIKLDKESNHFEFDDKNVFDSLENVFRKLTKGEEQPIENDDENGCCRV